ncbi:thiamine diphosphokinase [Bacillus massiliigorillae]|uniref:thiamine diphosphokinase n=1 Tax=Bacillus massiliigorillae TaxID=1243664 RepID=UPI00039F65AC|nr:thiamine diphosphokinase [Bacillus massiliigorillae]
MKTIYLMAGGPIENIPDISQYEQPDVWVGIDKGISTLVSLGVTPSVVFGDFDSIEPKDLQYITDSQSTIFQFPSEKDDTDLALAFDWALKQQPDCIKVFGNTGGRMDHSMGGIQLLVEETALKSSTKVTIEDRWNTMFAVIPGTYTIANNQKFKYISFFTISPQVEGITLTGFKYPLNNRDLPLGSTLCVSNELISESGTFSFTSGILLVIRSNDSGA